MKIVLQILKIFLVINIAILAISFFLKDGLPPLDQIDSSLQIEPAQTSTETQPFSVQWEDATYTFKPLFNYELRGLIVSEISNENFFTQFITHKMNTKDICVLWGKNVQSAVYHDYKYSNKTWSCHIVPKKNYISGQSFFENQVSNNHLLPQDQKINSQIRKASIGDQIYLKGLLVSYSINNSGGWRESSITREDQVCEVIFITDFKIIRQGNYIFEFLFGFSKYVLIGTVLGLITLFLIYLFSPTKPRKFTQEEIIKMRPQTNEEIKKEIEEKIRQRKLQEQNLKK